jgi:hypothetical protein
MTKAQFRLLVLVLSAKQIPFKYRRERTSEGTDLFIATFDSRRFEEVQRSLGLT